MCTSVLVGTIFVAFPKQAGTLSFCPCQYPSIMSTSQAGIWPSVPVTALLWCPLYKRGDSVLLSLSAFFCDVIYISWECVLLSLSVLFWMSSIYARGICPSVSGSLFLWCHLHQLRVCSSVPVSIFLNVLYISWESVLLSLSVLFLFCPLHKLKICPSVPVSNISVSALYLRRKSVLLSLSGLFLLCPLQYTSWNLFFCLWLYSFLCPLQKLASVLLSLSALFLLCPVLLLVSLLFCSVLYLSWGLSFCLCLHDIYVMSSSQAGKLYIFPCQDICCYVLYISWESELLTLSVLFCYVLYISRESVFLSLTVLFLFGILNNLGICRSVPVSIPISDLSITHVLLFLSAHFLLCPLYIYTRGICPSVSVSTLLLCPLNKDGICPSVSVSLFLWCNL